MIHYLQVKNFTSFRDVVEISFKVDNNATERNSIRVCPDRQRYSTLLASFGANASGKTNVLKAFAFLLWFMKSPLRNPGESGMLFVPFLFTENLNEPTEFFIEYSDKSDVYRYCLKLDKSRVLFEQLSMLNKNARKRTFQYIFRRTVSSFKGRSLRMGSSYDKMGRQIPETISAFSYLEALGSKPIIQAAIPLSFQYSNVMMTGRESDVLRSFDISNVARLYLKDEILKNRVERYLAMFDTGLTGIDIKEEVAHIAGNKLEAVQITGLHEIQGAKYPLAFPFESNGTRYLFSILFHILRVLDRGGFAIIDEIETSLHHRVVEFIIKLFADQDANPHGAQLLFTTHATSLLNEFDKRQILLVEKNGGTQVSTVQRLSDIQGVRSDDNYRAKYEAGVFGAVPEV